jgi:hypothetical protein
MMRIQMLKAVESRPRLPKGRELDLPQSRASYLIAQGLARPVRVEVRKETAKAGRGQGSARDRDGDDYLGYAADAIAGGGVAVGR